MSYAATILDPWRLVRVDVEAGPQGRSVSSGVASPARLWPAVGQQLVDPLCRMRADPIEEIGLRVREQDFPPTVGGGILGRC